MLLKNNKYLVHNSKNRVFFFIFFVPSYFPSISPFCMWFFCCCSLTMFISDYANSQPRVSQPRVEPQKYSGLTSGYHHFTSSSSNVKSSTTTLPQMSIPQINLPDNTRSHVPNFHNSVNVSSSTPTSSSSQYRYHFDQYGDPRHQ